MEPGRPSWRQVLGSLLIAAVIVLLAILLVTARVGSGGLAERDDHGGSELEHESDDD